MLYCCVLQVTVTYKAWQCTQLYLVLKDNVQLHDLPGTFDPINKICPLNLYSAVPHNQ